jgi:hypothetical protein
MAVRSISEDGKRKDKLGSVEGCQRQPMVEGEHPRLD